MSEPATETLIDVLMPQMGVSVTEGTVIGWAIEIGDHVALDDTLCEISTDKIDTELPAPVNGVLAEILIGVGETVPVGTALARIATTDAAPGVRIESQAAAPPAASPPPGRIAGQASPAPETHPADPQSEAAQTSRYSPVVGRIAATHGVDLSQVTGTGRGGRVSKQDVLAFVEQLGAAANAPRQSAAGGVARADRAPGTLAPKSGQLPRMRRLIAERMRRSLATAAHCHTWIEIDMSAVESARKALGTPALPFVARAAIDALRIHPQLNAWLQGDTWTVHDQVHLGIAVSLGEDRLIVPVIRNANELVVEGIAARTVELTTRAREGRLTPDEVGGATFTITNPGGYGSTMAAPIIDLPQVAILDLEAITKRVVVVQDARGNDAMAIRPMTTLGLAWDHRALDGALAAQFLATIKGNLEA